MYLQIRITLKFLDEIQKQPLHVREMMFVFSVIITVSLVGIVWFRSFEEDLFVLINPEPEKQEKFYAEREKRMPIVYANLTEALGEIRASLYSALGFIEEYNKNKVQIEEELKGETHQLPVSGDK